MPEGDVVWRTARQLHDALAGRVLTRSDFRVPRYATADLTGRAVIETVSRGKHLLTRVDGDVTVHTHLRMDGSWRISRAGGYPPGGHRVRLVLANDEWQAVGLQLGVVEVLRTSREHQAVGHLGPDLLGPDWDQEEAVRRLMRQPDRPVAEALLDQSNLAGIGNLYKAEVLFLRGVSPRRPVGEALLDQHALAGIGNLYKAEVLFLRGINPWQRVGSVADLGGLAELARRLLDANKERIGQVTTGNWRRGEETWVYGRRGRPCRRCGTPIRTEGQQDRVTFWCPSCQAAQADSLAFIPNGRRCMPSPRPGAGVGRPSPA